MKMLAIAVFLAAAAPAFADGECRSRTAGSPAEAVFCKLEPDTRVKVRDHLMLARSLYVQEKYQLCLEELSRLQDIVDTYQDSDQLHESCLQGLRLVLHKNSRIQRRTAGH